MKQPLSERVSVLLGITVPFFGALYAAYLVTVNTGDFDWFYVKLCLFLYVFTGLGITIGYHRLFTHESFKTSKAMELFFAILGTVAVQAGLIEWCARHSQHHQRSDKEGDPHSPWVYGDGPWNMFKGLLHAHVLWIFKLGPYPDNSCSRRLKQNPRVAFVDKTTPFWFTLSLAFPALIGYVHDPEHGLLLGFLWGSCMRIFIVQHVTWSINSYCHMWGKRTFATSDRSGDSILFGILALGEGFHNGHHAFPQSSKHGFIYPWLDLSYVIITTLERLGLVYDVKRISEEDVERKLVQS